MKILINLKLMMATIMYRRSKQSTTFWNIHTQGSVFQKFKSRAHVDHIKEIGHSVGAYQ